MLRLFFRVLAAFMVLVGLVLLIGSLLPRHYNIEASTEIGAPVSAVFPQVNRLENWEHWSPISESRIEDLEAEYSGEVQGEGAIQTWTESRGSGKMWIEESQVDQLIGYSWRFDGFPDLKGRFEFETTGEGDQAGCQVIWRSEGKLPGGPFYGFFGLVFEEAMTAEYQKCLDRLKTIVEEGR